MSARVKRTYSDNDKALTLAALDAHEGSAQLAALATGVPERTVYEWAAGKHVNEDVANIRESKKLDLAEELERVALALLGKFESKMPAAKLSEAAIAVAICIDKAQLLKGNPTSINSIGQPHDFQRKLESLRETREQRKLAKVVDIEAIAHDAHITSNNDDHE